MSLLSSLLVLIVAARLLGKIFAKYNQPELIGEILAGILLGPAVLDFIQPTAALAGISELAVFLIILSAGLEMRIGDVLGAMRGRGMILAALSFAMPFLGESQLPKSLSWMSCAPYSLVCAFPSRRCR